MTKSSSKLLGIALKLCLLETGLVPHRSNVYHANACHGQASRMWRPGGPSLPRSIRSTQNPNQKPISATPGSDTKPSTGRMYV